MGENTILITLSAWAVKNLGIKESLSEVGTEILKKCIWTPLKEKIVKFFSSDKETQDFLERISNQKCVNEQKPERDIEDIYEEMKNQTPDIELFEAITNFFKDNQNLVAEANRMKGEWKGNSINVNKIENFINANEVSTINIYPKN